MNKSFLILFIGSLFIACSNKKNSADSGIVIDLEQETSVCVSDLFESIDVVQLETNEDCLIQAINKIIFHTNRYYILDEKQQKLLCFDSVGKFLFKIDQKGQGPEEYVHISDFNIDPYEQTLLLLEPWGNLFTFDLEGRFISKIKLPEEILAYNEVHSLNKDTLLFVSLNKYTLVTYSKITNSITDKQYDEAKGCVFHPINKTYRYNNQLFYSPTPTNDIRNLSKNTVFSWDFGKMNNSQKQIKKIKKIIQSEEDCPDMMKRQQPRDFVREGLINYKITGNYETSRYKICSLDCGYLNFRYVFFDKQANKANVFEKTKEGIQFLKFYFAEESIIVSDLPGLPFEYKFYDKSILSEEQQKIIDSYMDDFNPFIIKYNLKQ
jgi:hypothetical protein